MRSCSSRQQFGQIRSCAGSSRWRYCLREGWWPDRRRARRASSFLLFICFVSRETLRYWYTEATRSCVSGASRIASLITWMELGRKIGRIVFVARWWILWLLCWLDRYLEWKNSQGSIERKWKTIWSWWSCGLRMLEDGMRWELHTRTYCLCKRVWRLKDGWRWWVSRIVQVPWQLLSPHRSW